MPKITRRRLMEVSTAAITLPSAIDAFAQSETSKEKSSATLIDDFDRADSTNLGDNWESLNLGYWSIKDKSLRRRLKNVGDRARKTGFPFHYESVGRVMKTDYDPSLPLGVIWSRKWKMTQSYVVSMAGRIEKTSADVDPSENPNWKNFSSAYGLVGLALEGANQHEGHYTCDQSSAFFAVREDGRFGFFRHGKKGFAEAGAHATNKIEGLTAGDTFLMSVSVKNSGDKKQFTGRIKINGGERHTVSWSTEDFKSEERGFIGIACRGLLDAAITSIATAADESDKLIAPVNECHVCYALGDTLEEQHDEWFVKFISIFRNDGGTAEIRISDKEHPEGGWKSVPVAGNAEIISNDFRKNTASIKAKLPANPSTKTLYYTIWKDGENVTADPRQNTNSVGPGTGIVGDVPSNGGYVGRLPQLTSPYRLCGLSCHAIYTASYSSLEGAGRGQSPFKNMHKPYYIHDQPCQNAFQHVEDFKFQVMLWEDDIWYLEMPFYPPSTDDAYRIITLAIAGCTSRWQMMRHWNILNPGDHDHGMDDVKGPEQYVIRNKDGLGQDREYMVRNFRIVSHLISGDEEPSGLDNPKRWRRWKMPEKDFSLLITDSRLWRDSQDTAIWNDEGWTDKTLYSRTTPNRPLLGEEQFSWLENIINTDSSSLICVTGINSMLTVWGGFDESKAEGKMGERYYGIRDRDRVGADYAGWAKAGSDRVMDVLTSRPGVVSVYGDVHIGSIFKNKANNLLECSFGPIGRWGGRVLVDGFSRDMVDYDGRPVECISLYHQFFKDADLTPAPDGHEYWNFLEMNFDTKIDDPEIGLAVRNMVDAPSDKKRGGGHVKTSSKNTGRNASSIVKGFQTLANAEILLVNEDGYPVRGSRSDGEGNVPDIFLVDVPTDEALDILVRTNTKTESVRTKTKTAS